MSPEEMELAYVVPWEKTAIAASLWSGYAGSSGGSGGGQGQGRGGRARKASQPMHGRTHSTAGQLMCPSHGKLCKKGICSGMSRLVREKVVVGEVGFLQLWPFGLFILFSVSVGFSWTMVFASCGFCFWFRFCFRFFHHSCLRSLVFCSSWFRYILPT